MFSDKLQLSLINNTLIKNPIDDTHFAQGLAGFVKDGSYAWIVHESTLEILSTETGAKIAHHNFGKHNSGRGCVITCVEEIDYLPGICILAVAIEFSINGASAGMLSVFCAQGSKILGSMDFCERITCCRYIPKAACDRCVLRNFRGTVAIGTDQGKLFLIDLMLPKNAHEIAASPSYEADLFPCLNVCSNVNQDQIAVTHAKLAADQQVPDKSFFSIQLEVLNDSSAILSIMPMSNLFTMAVGLNDGRLVLYDLVDLQAFHLAYPPSKPAPLTHMSYIEPTDDPKCAVYVWAFHSSHDGAIAVMHSLMFNVKNEGIYDEFKSCSSRLTMPMYVKDTFPICCRSITRGLSQDEEDVLTLSVLAWTAPATKRTHLMIFDLNQWYKEEMPNIGDWRMKLKYVSVFELSDCIALDAIVNENSVFPFNSIQRPEEHFYPNSLSFDVCFLESDKFTHMRWYGIQNIVLQQFNVVGPQIIIEPSYYFNELLQVAIVPQFSDVPYNLATPLDQKREFLMSVALEYNFNGFLKKCAWAWADGSYVGKDNTVGVGLSTLTDWIWNRVRAIKDVCNVLCKPLFDFSEQRIDYGTQKQLSQCCKQLKVLSDLQTLVLRDYKQFIPDVILLQLQTQSEEIKMASDYQEVLQWLLNVGLLPEGHYDPNQNLHGFDDDFLIVPYPYQVIKSYYESQRMKLADEWMGEAKYLFIDAFIEHNCEPEKLRKVWGGVYPPRSIQALLRTLLIPEISVASKHVIFVYLFMDITNVLKDGAYSSIVRNLIKFPAVFKMNPAMIKRTQAFWNLDNGNLETAVEELISPLSHDKHIPLWQRELLIGALLKQGASSLALRSLRCPGNQISPELEVFTLLSNNLMSEALKVQRASGDKRLLVKLFEKILHSPNYEQLLDLSLTEEEGVVLREYLQNLKDTGLPNHLNIHFVFLLQRSKFLDAAQLVESMNETEVNLEPPKQVLNAYYATMESTTRKLTSMVCSDDVQVKESPLPLSVNLIQARCNAKNNIYQKCVQSINEAAYSENQMNQTQPFIGSPRLGIFEYRQTPLNVHDISYALEINEHGKRKQGNKNGEEFIRLEDLQAPQQKKRKLNEPAVKRKSYMDMRLNNLTVFKESKPNYSFTGKSPSSSMRTTPERVHAFGSFRNFLTTPIIEKKTPPAKVCPPTPHSILKTRSRCGSISPAPSRFSELGDDNKSVKSITFAALPDSRDTSLNDSSVLEENFNEEEKMETSTENFYSPEKEIQSLPQGPKPRKPLSRSTTPAGTSQEQKEEKTAHEENLNVTGGSEESDDLAKPFREGSILKETSNYDSDEASDTSVPDNSIYNYVRRSVLPANFGEISDSNDEDEAKEKPEENSEDSVADEHFEEEELPEHSDYSDSSEENGEEYEYGDVDLQDSESASQQSAPKVENDGDVICLDSSDEDDVQQMAPALPSFGAFVASQEDPVESSEIPNEDPPFQTEEEILYDDLSENQMDAEDIESPPYERLSPEKQQKSMLTREEIEAGPEQFELMDEIEKVPEIDENVIEVECEEIEEVQDQPEGQEEVLALEEPQLAPEKQPAPEVSKSAPEEQQSAPESFKSPLNLNDSGASEECSFISAAGGELNEAVLMTVDQTVEITAEEEQFEEIQEVEAEAEVEEAGEAKETELEDAKEPSADEDTFKSSVSAEATNILDQAINQSEISMETAKEDVTAEDLSTQNEQETAEDLSIPKSIQLQIPTAADESPKETLRELRARSVPSSGSSSPRSRSTRASTEDREKPKNLRKTKALERIEENASPVPSPGPLTRRRSQLQLAEEVDNTPQTPTRMTRRRSLLMEEAPATPTTPTRRLTRAASRDSLAPSEPEKTPEETATLTRQRSLRNRTTSASDNDDAKSTRSTRSSKKKSETPTSSTKVTPEKESPVEATELASLTNRRLTRKQMQVLEKSRQLAERMATGGTLKASKSEDLHLPHHDDSDNESVKSDSGSVASSRASRKRKAVKRFNSQDDSSSVASKSSRKSQSPSGKWNQLSVIPEESVVEESTSGTPAKRTRKPKK